MATRKQGTWIRKDLDLCELEGPYECPHCGYHVMLDATYLDQVAAKSSCPGCRYSNLVAPDENEPEYYDGDKEEI